MPSCIMFDNFDLTAVVKDNPKIVGILFALLLFLTKAGAVSASQFGATAGP